MHGEQGAVEVMRQIHLGWWQQACGPEAQSKLGITCHSEEYQHSVQISGRSRGEGPGVGPGVPVTLSPAEPVEELLVCC